MGSLGKVHALVALLLAIYIASPVIFRNSPFIQRSLLFMNHVNTQYHVNLSQPEQLGLKCTRALRLSNSPGQVELGVWHILPASSVHKCAQTLQGTAQYPSSSEAFADKRPIVLYVHGNGGNRAGNHRSQLYHKLAYQFDLHVVAFDYRGYGDSTYLQPSAQGLSEDARFMYKWLLAQEGVESADRIIVWGHSLGTAVSVQALAETAASYFASSTPAPSKASPPTTPLPAKLVLEAPFDSVANAIATHPLSAPFRVIPYFEYYFIDPIRDTPELNFDSISRIGQIGDSSRTKILILHAEDDGIIPFQLGKNLYEEARRRLGDSRVKFFSIAATHGLGHKHICQHDETMAKVYRFITEE